jgi:hypothetical protein
LCTVRLRLDESAGLVLNLKLEEATPVTNLSEISDDFIPHLEGSNPLQASLSDELVYANVIAQVDGQRTVKQIADIAHVNLESARKAVCDLKFHQPFFYSSTDIVGHLVLLLEYENHVVIAQINCSKTVCWVFLIRWRLKV